MNVNAVPVLLDHIAKKSMLVHRVHVPTMAFALIYLKDTMAIRINVYALTVSLTEFSFYSLLLFSTSFTLIINFATNIDGNNDGHLDAGKRIENTQTNTSEFKMRSSHAFWLNSCKLMLIKWLDHFFML